MTQILFQSIDLEAGTVTVKVNGTDITRPLPDSTLSSPDNLAEYMKLYVDGLKIEFPDEAPTMAPNQVPFTSGQDLGSLPS